MNKKHAALFLWTLFVLVCLGFSSPMASAQEAKPAEPPPTDVSTPEAEPIQLMKREEIVAMGNNVVLRTNERTKNVVVFAGDVTIDGVVERDVVILSGNLTLNGTIKGDMVVVLGSVTMGSNAVVRRDAVVIGGAIQGSSDAKIGGERVEVSIGKWLPNFKWLKDWLGHGLLFGRPFPPQVRWVWPVMCIFAAVYLLLALLFPGAVRSCVETLENRPAGSFFVGLLAFLFFGPLLFVLVVSVAGIIVIPFLFCAIVAAILFGKVAILTFTGRQLGKQTGLAFLQSPLVSLLIGALLIAVLYMIPVIGLVVWGLATVLGMGAVVMAIFGSFRREPASPMLSTFTVPSAMPPVAAGSLAEPPPSSAGISSGTGLETVSYARVGFWLRLWATLLDAILFILLAFLPMHPLIPILWVAYHIGMWTWKGTTIGGIVVGIQVLRTDGRPVNLAVATVRALSSFFSALALFLGFFWAGWDREKQSWHDKIAGTVVVRVPRGVALI